VNFSYHAHALGAETHIVSCVGDDDLGREILFCIRQSYYDCDIVHEMLKLFNVLKLNDEELPVMTGLLEIDGDKLEVLKALADRSPSRMIVLPRDDKGSLLYARGETSVYPGMSVEVVGTVGADDAFTATIVMGSYVVKIRIGSTCVPTSLLVTSVPRQGRRPECPRRNLRDYYDEKIDDHGCCFDVNGGV